MWIDCFLYHLLGRLVRKANDLQISAHHVSLIDVHGDRQTKLTSASCFELVSILNTLAMICALIANRNAV